MNFSNEPPVPPPSTSMEEPVIKFRGWDLTDPDKAIFLNVRGVLNPPSEVLAISEFGVTWGGLTLFLSSKCCLTTIPVETDVLAGT